MNCLLLITKNVVLTMVLLSAMANDRKIQSKHKIKSNDLTDLSDQNDSERDDLKKKNNTYYNHILCTV
jgi:hypothetical protein